MAARIRKGDTVLVTAGADKGKHYMQRFWEKLPEYQEGIALLTMDTDCHRRDVRMGLPRVVMALVRLRLTMPRLRWERTWRGCVRTRGTSPDSRPA